MPDSTKNPISILLRAPVTMKIGPVPADLTSSDQIMSFGLNNFARILSEKGIAADVDGQFAPGSFSIDSGPAAPQTTAGIRIDQRAAPVQDRKSTRLNSCHSCASRFPSSTFKQEPAPLLHY